MPLDTAARFRPTAVLQQANTCNEYAGSIKLIASIENPAVIKKILAHLDGKAPPAATALLPECRGPPQAKLFKGF